MISLFRIHVPVSALLLMALDVAVLAAAVALAVLAGAGDRPRSIPAGTFVAVTLVLAFGLGLHQRQYVRRSAQTLLRLAACFALAFVALAVLSALAPAARLETAVLLPAAAAGFAGMAAARAVYRRFADIGLFRRRVLVVGAGPRAAEIEELAERHAANFLCVGCVPDGGRVAVGAERLRAPLPSLVALVRRENIAEIVLAGEPEEPDRYVWSPRGAGTDAPLGLRDAELLEAARTRPDPDEATFRTGHALPSTVPLALAHDLLECRLRGIGVTDYLSFVEHEKGEVDLDRLHASWLILGDGYSWARARQRAAKRAFDVAASLGLLAVALPLLAAAALAILIEDGRPILYRQERVGLRGRTFRLLKFRSMRADAEKDGVARWASRGDGRVTRVGALLRRTRVDEIPQILNVLRGEMSFVGPRPERPVFVDALRRELPFYDCRHYVKPGITGWAQINFDYGASVEDAKRKLQFDLYYIKNYSIVLDLLILIQTVRVILWPPRR